MEILLHVGHGKTGSSFLQSSLALSKTVLAEHGITYPDAQSDAIAIMGKTTGGNFDRRQKLLATIKKNTAEKILLSSEHLFARADDIIALTEHFPGAKISVLLFIRDPLDHAISRYNQNVKRNGYTDDLGSHLKSAGRMKDVGNFLKKFENHPAKVTVRNYSRHKSSIKLVMEQWLGLSEGVLETPPVSKINRSLTQDELAIQRVLNRRNGNCGGLFADIVSEETPLLETSGEKIPLSKGSLQEFLTSQTELAKELSKFIPIDEGYHVPDLKEASEKFCEPSQSKSINISMANLDVLARVIAERDAMFLLERAQRHLSASANMLRRKKIDNAQRSLNKASSLFKSVKKLKVKSLQSSLKAAEKRRNQI